MAFQWPRWRRKADPFAASDEPTTTELIVSPEPQSADMRPESMAAAQRLTEQLRLPSGIDAGLVTQRIAEQINATALASNSPTQEDWYWGRLASGIEEDYFWRRLSDNWYQKDVIPAIWLELHNLCYEAYNANPLAFTIIEMTVNFVVGENLVVQAANKKVQKVLDGFWNDPKNHMDSRVQSLCMELALYGEQFIRFYVNPYNGATYIRQIDPSLIDEIQTDPEDIENELRFHRRPIGPSSTLPGDPVPILPQDEHNFEGEWYIAGSEMLHFAINKVSNAKRGKSDLATILPWLNRYKDWLTDRVRINKYKGAFLWDVTLKGADAKTIKAKQADYMYPPEPGSSIIHNDAEVWQAVQPKIDAGDAYQDGRAIKMMVAVGASLPEHYLSDGAENNQATASQMGLPTFLKFKRRQKVMENLLRGILDRVIAEAQQVGMLSQSANTRYDILFPEINLEDKQVIATATQYIVAALSTAKLNGWISDETAMQMLFEFAGKEMNIHDEQARVAAQPPMVSGAPVQPASLAGDVHINV